MPRSALVRPAALLTVLLLAAGCLSGAPGAGPSAPDTPVTETPTATSPTAAPTAAPDPVTVEYRVRAGAVPDEFESVTVTFRAVFVDRTTDLGPCYPEVHSGPYKPTLTPIATPAGGCHRSESVTVDLAELDGTRSLGTFTAPGSASGHALLVTDVTATRRNGTSVTGIKNIGGAELLESPERPAGTHGVNVSVETVEDGRDYDYWLVWERFEPSG